MPINLSKGQKVDLTKGNPSLKNIIGLFCRSFFGMLIDHCFRL